MSATLWEVSCLDMFFCNVLVVKASIIFLRGIYSATKVLENLCNRVRMANGHIFKRLANLISSASSTSFDLLIRISRLTAL